MYNNSYVYKFIMQIKNHLSEDTEHYLFVKHYNPISITEDLFHSSYSLFQDSKNEPLLLCYEFTSSQMQSSFEPFLIWIRNLYITYFPEVSPEEFIKACHIYSGSVVKTKI